ncbi:unnamed protein product [Ectocarpus sp. 6 AP-2014]
MAMSSGFNQRIGNSRWPASLRRLTLGGSLFSQSLQGLGSWMPNLEALRLLLWTHPEDFDLETDSQKEGLLRGIEWPMGLRQLTVFEEYSLFVATEEDSMIEVVVPSSTLDGVVIPSSVQVYRPDMVR